jgi:hypothetical protein
LDFRSEKNQNDRHLSGGGKIYVEKRVLSEYLQIINQTNLKEKDYDIIEVEEEIATTRINEIENQKYESESGIDDNKRFLKPTEMTNEELEYFIDYYKDYSINGRYLKGRKNSRNTMNELIGEKENRKKKLKRNF